MKSGHDDNINTQIAEFFFLLEGIGFVWIIRVFLLIAIVIPLCLKVKLKINKIHYYLLWIVCLSLLSDIFVRWGIESRSLVINEFVLYMIGYDAIFW